MFITIIILFLLTAKIKLEMFQDIYNNGNITTSISNL